MKLNNFLVVFIFLLLCCSFLLIQEPTGKVVDVNSMLKSEKFYELKDYYNKNIKYVPKIIKKTFGNENLNVYIFMNDKSERLVGVVLRNGVINDLKVGGLGDPTMNAYVSEETINKIVDKKLDIINALDNGDITYKSLKPNLKDKLFGWLS